jgi:hypothetical protein
MAADASGRLSCDRHSMSRRSDRYPRVHRPTKVSIMLQALAIGFSCYLSSCVSTDNSLSTSTPAAVVGKSMSTIQPVVRSSLSFVRSGLASLHETYSLVRTKTSSAISYVQNARSKIHSGGATNDSTLASNSGPGADATGSGEQPVFDCLQQSFQDVHSCASSESTGSSDSNELALVRYCLEKEMQKQTGDCRAELASINPSDLFSTKSGDVLGRSRVEAAEGDVAGVPASAKFPSGTTSKVSPALTASAEAANPGEHATLIKVPPVASISPLLPSTQPILVLPKLEPVSSGDRR